MTSFETPRNKQIFWKVRGADYFALQTHSHVEFKKGETDKQFLERYMEASPILNLETSVGEQYGVLSELGARHQRFQIYEIAKETVTEVVETEVEKVVVKPIG